MTKILHLHVKKKYWRQVRDGSKVEEYRRFNLKLLKRLLIGYDFIHYHLGYTSKKQKERTMIFKWNGFYDAKIKHEIFGNRYAHVFVIPLKEQLKIGDFL